MSPAGPVIESDLHEGIRSLQSLDLEVILGPHVYHRRGYTAGEDGLRLKDLHDMFRNQKIKAILCARGGYGSLRLLKGINFALIRRHPKILVGYSDITALLLALHKRTGLVCFHGPVVKEFVRNERKNLISLLDLVMSNGMFKIDLSKGKAIREGRAKGIFIGGNLSLLTTLIGTPYMPSLKGSILFIEERGEPLYRIDRMLTQLKLSGALKGLAGIVTGGFEDCGDILGIEDLFLEAVSASNIPVVSGLPVSHGEENMTVPIGIPVILDTDGMTLSSTESCVVP
ncbi:MAG: LD-carboxypeptidase [Pseudomonadota bacterium]